MHFILNNANLTSTSSCGKAEFFYLFENLDFLKPELNTGGAGQI